MSIVQALADKHAAGELARMALKDLPETCCQASELEVYDMDGYARSLKQAEPPATVDGAWTGELRGRDHLVLIEMKSLKNVAREFHFGECAEAERGNDHEETVSNCQTAFKEFVDQKIREWYFAGKMQGTQDLLTGIDPNLPQEIKEGEVAESCIIACDLSYGDFLLHRQTFRAALKPLASETWGEPVAMICSWLNNEQTLREKTA